MRRLGGWYAGGVVGDDGFKGAIVSEPALDDIVVEVVFSEGLFEQKEATMEVATVDGMGFVDLCDGAARVGVWATDVL